MRENYKDKREKDECLSHRRSFTCDITCHNKRDLLHQYIDQCICQTSADIDIFTLAFFDMDNLTQIVRNRGFLFGEKVLEEVVKVVYSLLDSKDCIFRYGGDEFIVILQGQGRAEALSKVETIRKGISSASYPQGKEIHLRITASFGLATFPDDGRDPEQLLMVADHCLFQSKKEGKNRISVWSK